MPRLRRRSKRQPAPMADHQLQTLTRGFPARRTQAGMAFYGDRDAQRCLWEANREPLLEWWIGEHPGRRPAAWWLFDAPEPRRRVAGPEGAERAALLDEMNAKWPGLRTMWTSFGLPKSHLKLMGDKYESEIDYLRRLSLLTPWEAEQCPA